MINKEDAIYLLDIVDSYIHTMKELVRHGLVDKKIFLVHCFINGRVDLERVSSILNELHEYIKEDGIEKDRCKND